MLKGSKEKQLSGWVRHQGAIMTWVSVFSLYVTYVQKDTRVQGQVRSHVTLIPGRPCEADGSISPPQRFRPISVLWGATRRYSMSYRRGLTRSVCDREVSVAAANMTGFFSSSSWLVKVPRDGRMVHPTERKKDTANKETSRIFNMFVKPQRCTMRVSEDRYWSKLN